MRACALADIPAGRLRTAALAAYAAQIEHEARSGEKPTPTAAAPAKAGRARSPMSPPGIRARGRYRCGSCGARETAYARAERHADEHGGARIELELVEA